LNSGVHRIGEIEIKANASKELFTLCHQLDCEQLGLPDYGGLEVHRGPAAARDLSTYSQDHVYRFTKGQVNLRRGWVMILTSISELRLALDQFYPASIGLWKAAKDGTLEIQNLRDKLERQTGMYRSAKFISTAGAQELVQKVCGPAHQCAKRILWRIEAETPLADSEASRYDGIASGLPETEAIPLICQEACNHFVSECRKVSKAENEAKNSNG
jgi:hypothetical protein